MSKEYRNRKYSVMPYDPSWKRQFTEQAQILGDIFGKTATIEHVGSTAVPGLAGKPTIDILVLINDIGAVANLTHKMESAGYMDLGEYLMPGTCLFAKESMGSRLINVHVFPKNHPHAKEMLVLRDYFQNSPEIVKEYSKLKFDLYAKYPDNYAEYRRRKDEWMDHLKRKLTETN